MYRKIKLIVVIFYFLGLNFQYQKSFAQFSLGAQLRTRAEIRDGFANLLPKTASSSSFVSQRTRMIFGYKYNNLSFGINIQDVRVWGQDASTISSNDGNRLGLHEGWAEIILANKADSLNKFNFLDHLSVKIGRQELIYDDARLIGNLDWLQQARRFDMVLIKTLHKGWQLDIGYAYNQNNENYSGDFYIPGNIPKYVKNDIGVIVPTPLGMVPLLNAAGNSSATGNPAYTNPPATNGGTQDYKNFISIFTSKKFHQTKLSGLYFQDDFGRYRAGNTEAGGGNVFGRYFDVKGTSDRYTYGGMILQTVGSINGFGKIALQGAYYKQNGRDRDNKQLNAYHYTASLNYTKGKFSLGPGYDVLSGNKNGISPTESRRFDPLYGTPHKFWGAMDYFYAGTGSPNAGLKNAYFKTKFSTPRYSLGIDFHHFNAANPIAFTTGKYLANELDFSATYNFNKFTTVDFGYSFLRGGEALSFSKNQSPVIPAANFDSSAQWAYLMINIRPEFISKN
ncbi:MAG: alginate export family protein [Daejeonella sp.]